MTILAPARRLIATARAQNWWSSKLPPLFAVAYAHVLRERTAAPQALAALAAALVALCAVAWHAHVINDLCDETDDRRTGKPNRIAGMPRVARVALVTLLPALGLGAAASPFVEVGIATTVLAANLAVFLLYSVPPIRLKIRRWWGVAADAIGAHALPTLFVLSAMPGGIGSGMNHALFAASALTWSLAAGLRGILVHQFLDRGADQMAGLSTVGTTRSLPWARAIVLRVLRPIEAAGLALFVLLTVPVAPLLAVGVAMYLAVEIGKVRRRWILPLFEPAETSVEPYRLLLNNDVYELWLPNVLALQLAAVGGAFVALPLVQIGLFLSATRRRARDVAAIALPHSTERIVAATEDGSARLLATETGSSGPAPISVTVSPSEPVGSAEPTVPGGIASVSHQVAIGATYWVVNGVNIFSANLARGLVAAGESAHVLLTESATRLISFQESLMPRPADVPFVELGVRGWESWGAHWGEMLRYLESISPCIYIPNSDWRHSSVCPLLSDRVGVVGVVHSDDPLHYDHVLRLGAYWNAIVTVSTTLAERTAALLPHLADRIVTIPIGVSIPDRPPQRSRRADEPIRLIYHGSLKIHQKRILDLPRIVEALAARGIPARLTIAGGGPDEGQLRESARALVERGLIEFRGVVAHDAISALLVAHDVYLLTSEFEGMPNALIEAMGHGLVPVVTRIASGPTELVRDGENGFLVPVGETEGFVERLALLQREPERQQELSASAFESVCGSYRVQDMVADYRALFQRVLDDARSGRFVRPRGELAHPPASVAGVDLFPVALTHHVPGVGAFPTANDFHAFRERVRQLPEGAPAGELLADPEPPKRFSSTLPADVSVIVGAPLWTRNGVNVHSENLVRGLASRGLRARLLITEEHTDLVTVREDRLPWPANIPVDVLPVARDDGWGAHWGATVRYLEQNAPCFYLPTFDWRHACVVPRLPPDVHVIGSAFIEDPCTLEQAARLAEYWSAVVVRNAASADAVRSEIPKLAERLVVIPDGCRIPHEPPRRARNPCGDVEVLVCAEAAMLAPQAPGQLLSALRGRGITARLTIMGSGAHPEAPLPDLGQQWRDSIECVPWPVPDRLLGRAGVVLAALASDGVPSELLEAMGWGVIPIILQRGSGLSGVFRPGENCALCAAGDMDSVAEFVASLTRDPSLRDAMSLSAHLSAKGATVSHEDVVDAYLSLFADVLNAARSGQFSRASGPIQPPPARVAECSVFPVALEYDAGQVGRFPSAADYEAYERMRAPKSDNAATGRPGGTLTGDRAGWRPRLPHRVR